MKQKVKRALWVLVCLMAIGSAGAQTIVKVGGLQYSLNGAYASVYDAVNYTKIKVPESIVYEGLTYTVNTVGEKAFYYSDIYDNPSYTSSDKERYSDNKKITEVSLPNTIVSIRREAFCNSAIKSVKLSEGIVSIDTYAFAESSITSIIIPSSVTTMEAPFYKCDKLRTIVYLSATPPAGWTATSFTYVPSKKTYSSPVYSINNASVIEMVSFSDDTFTYTGKAPNVVWTNNVEGYTAELTLPALPTDVGTHNVNIPAKFTKDEESFEVEIPYSYTIQPVSLTAKVNDTNRLYGEDNPEFSISYTGFINGDDESAVTTKPTVATTAKTTSSVGTYPVTISGGVAKNYTLEYEAGALTINKAPLTINVNEASRKYGQNNPTFSLGYVGLKNGESAPTWTTAPTFTTNAKKKSDVGAYTVQVACDPQNYEATVVEGVLNVTQAPLTIKANNATRPYCGKEPEYSFTYSGFVSGDTENVLTQKPIMATDATATSNVGEYTLMPQGASAKNYAIQYQEGTLAITQCPLVVKVAPATRGYGENNPTFSIFYEGFVNNDTEAVLLQRPTVSTSANVKSNVGTYDVRVSGGRAFNYALTYEDGQLSITPKSLRVSVGNYERPYNEENPTFTLLYDGFVAGDTEASLPTQPVARTTAVRTSACGTYPIEVSGGYSPNYDITYSAGVLTVSKAEQTFSWEQDLTDLTVHQQVELAATASSGLPVTYMMESIDGAEMYPAGKRTYLECKAPCEFFITAIQNGNDNYYSTQRITKKVKIASEEVDKLTLALQSSECGAISTKVEKGSVYTFRIQAEEGWKVHSVTFNDVDVTETLNEENSFIAPAITENSTLYVVYEEVAGNAVKALKSSSIKVLGTTNGIKVIGVPAGETLYVYADNGVLQKSVLSDGSSMEVLLPKNNVYLVKVGDWSMKVLVK